MRFTVQHAIAKNGMMKVSEDSSSRLQVPTAKSKLRTIVMGIKKNKVDGDGVNNAKKDIE